VLCLYNRDWADNSDVISPPLLESDFFLSGPGKRKLSEPNEGVFNRFKRTKPVTTAPSQTGKSSTYLDLQNNPSEKILDDRPQPDADIPPIPLLYDGFGHFLDVMDGHEDVPGLADAEVRELQDAVDDFAVKMTTFFNNEDDQRDVGLKCLKKIFAAHRAIMIPPIAAAAIGSVKSDGHNIARSQQATCHHQVCSKVFNRVARLLHKIRSCTTYLCFRATSWWVVCSSHEICGVCCANHSLPTASCSPTALEGSASDAHE
jgi:hypothetical protein